MKPCACRIEMPYVDSHLQHSYPIGSPGIVFCPLHESAQEMLETLKRAFQRASAGYTVSKDELKTIISRASSNK